MTYDDQVDQDLLRTYVAAGREFLTDLPVGRECVIMTIVPTLATGIETARAVATALGVNLVAPELDGLITFDGLHLDESSSERWSAAFIDAAGPQIRTCLSES